MGPARKASAPKLKQNADSYLSSTDSSQKTNTLCRIRKQAQRDKLLEEAAKILAEHEESLLPEHGGRQWQVKVTIVESNDDKDRKKGPLFRWYGGDLELGVLPHLLDQIEERVVVPKYKLIPKPDPNRFTSLSQNHILNRNGTDRGYNTTIEAMGDSAQPRLRRRWVSPDMKNLGSWKEVLDNIVILAKRDILIDKHIYGISASGKFIAAKQVSMKDALEAGHARFLKDGLWVVGQEESWQEGNAMEIER